MGDPAPGDLLPQSPGLSGAGAAVEPDDLDGVEAAAELDGKVQDTAGKTWWLALNDQERVIGFCAAIEQARPAGETHLMTFWVRPDQRGKGIGRQLFEARLKLHRPERPAFRGWCSTSSRPLYLAHGFSEVDQGVHDGHDWWEMHRPA